MIWSVLAGLLAMATSGAGTARPIVVPVGQEWNAELKPGQAVVFPLT